MLGEGDVFYFFLFLLCLVILAYNEPHEEGKMPMIDLKTIQLGHERVIGLQIKLPFSPMIFVFNTKGFLCGNQINIDTYKNNKACVCVMDRCNTYEECMNSTVRSCNLSANKKGIEIGMKGKEALQRMYEN